MEDSAPIFWSRAFTCGSVWGWGGKRMHCCLREQVVDDPLVLPFYWSLIQVEEFFNCFVSRLLQVKLSSENSVALMHYSIAHHTY